jgi:hypothetical protein
MMNSRAGFSAITALAIYIFMGFAPGALGQDAIGGNVERGSVALSQTSAGLLVLTLGPGPDRGRVPPPPPHPTNGCGNQNRGWDQWGGGNCSAVPEGGTTFLYLSLVGMCCVATAIYRIRRQVRVAK